MDFGIKLMEMRSYLNWLPANVVSQTRRQFVPFYLERREARAFVGISSGTLIYVPWKARKWKKKIDRKFGGRKI
jgi:hypothetical protein